MYDVNVVKDGVTTRVYHKHTSACYSAGHVHTDACYEWAGWGLCGGCNYQWNGLFDNHAYPCSNCGLYQIDEKQNIICGKAEGASTLICGYDV